MQSTDEDMKSMKREIHLQLISAALSGCPLEGAGGPRHPMDAADLIIDLTAEDVDTIVEKWIELGWMPSAGESYSGRFRQS
jgi:hypothetical protein